MSTLSKVPPSMQVRLLRPQTEDHIPHIAQEKIPIETSKFSLNFIKKVVSGSGLSLLIGAGIYTVMRMVGLEFGIVETSVIVLFPAMLGFLTSFVIF